MEDNDMRFPVISGYTFLREVGAGGTGQVFEAELQQSESPGKSVAVKVVAPSFGGNLSKAHNRFMREVEALKKLEHRSIVSFFGAGFTHESLPRPYIAMAFVKGITLSKMIPNMSFIERAEAIVSVLEALAYAHANGIFHRDVKPGNVIMRESDGQAVLVDFGLSYILNGLAAEGVTHSLIGTMGYIPPEVQSDPKLHTPQHDIYSCGAMLYEVMAGRKPVVMEIVPLSSVSLDLCGLDVIIQKALAPAASRYKEIKEFLADLKAWVTQRKSLSGIPVSPRILAFKEKLIEKKNKQDEEVKKAFTRKSCLEARIQAHHAQIIEMAELCFQEVHATLVEVYPGYALDRIHPTNELIIKTQDLIPYFSITAPEGRLRVSFGITWDHAKIDIQLVPHVVPRPAIKNSFVPRGMERCPPFWVIYTSVPHAGKNLTHKQGLIVCGTITSENNLESPQVKIFRGQMRANDNSILPPDELKTPEDIKDYFSYVLTAVLS
ncbi:MAG TPA: serine/threonine-protein kinase [Elusimicrobiales bacterium]|nr:serine/threonine-protein kinase [Elusimicrobiales bacterium]